MDDKERAKLVKESGPYSGHFKLDYARNCALLGVVPHPLLMGTRRATTVAEAEPAEAQQRKEKEEREAAEARGDDMEETESAQQTTQQAPLQPPQPVQPPPPSAAPPAKSKGAAAGKGGKGASAESKLSIAARLAAELAERVAALSPEDQLPVTELSVRGWTLDVGSAQALQMTMPYCKSLTTLRFWNASLSTRALTVLCEGLKGSAITRLHVDYNPLPADRGEEGGLVYSLMLAPSSPLQLLSLRGNRLCDEVCGELMRTLGSNKNLLALDLWDNELTDGCAADVARMLCTNPHIQSLNLSRNRLSNGAAVALSAAFASATVVDREEAKTLKKSGYKIVAIKNKTFREANSSLRYLHLADNYIGEPGLQAWLDVCAEQVKLAPQRGMVHVEGVGEVQAMTLLPPHILAEDKAKADQVAAEKAAEEAARAASAGPISTGRKGARSVTGAATAAAGGAAGAGPAAAGSGSKAASSAAAAAAALIKAEEEFRHPGQLNGLVCIDLTKQHCAVSERTWHALRCTPLVKWTSGPGDAWTPEGNLDIRAIDAAAAAAEEARRLQELSEEERARAAAEAEAAAEAARIAAANPPPEPEKEKKKLASARKERKAPPSAGKAKTVDE